MYRAATFASTLFPFRLEFSRTAATATQTYYVGLYLDSLERSLYVANGTIDF
jgi:hypothetical protein